jgi:hypothetical protein
MAISYPVSTPTDVIGLADIQLSATNAVAVSKSPFTFATQVHAYSGEMWSASVTIPTVRKELAEPWVAFLLSLRGQYGTFLLGDPNRATPQGTATTLSVQGAVGERSLSVTGINGTLKAGDYFQLGPPEAAYLYKVLVDYSIADFSAGTDLEIWPSLRAGTSLSGDSARLTNPRGRFRLASNSTQWGIGSSSAYSIQFEAMEDL